MTTPNFGHSYDPRAASSAAINRAIMAPHYMGVNAYSSEVSGGVITAHQQVTHQQNPFSFPAYTSATPHGMIPAFNTTFVSQRPLPRLMAPVVDVERMSNYHAQRQVFAEEHQRQSPIVKPEPIWTMTNNNSSFVSTNSKNVSPVPATPSTEVNFGTEVDTLMKAIQAKSQTPAQSKSSPAPRRMDAPSASPIPRYVVDGHSPHSRELTGGHHAGLQDSNSPKDTKKRYRCTISGCSKSFSQKTHLDIHERAHTGDKPYHCKEPGCGRSFSQLGNLKTHERRHTGERPYKCDRCDKRFAQRGNVRAHRIVHDNAKPYDCLLDDCGKKFTQLGNLKSHQNKFHADTIRALTSKFASFQDGDIVPAADKALWEYFANMYKNSNKGIKGRGKDRKVGPNHMAMNAGLRNLGGTTTSGYGMSGAGRSNMVMGVMGGGKHGTQFDMFEADDASHSSGQSTVGTCYDDAPGEIYEDAHRSGDLAFGDRMY